MGDYVARWMEAVPGPASPTGSRPPAEDTLLCEGCAGAGTTVLGLWSALLGAHAATVPALRGSGCLHAR